MGRTDAGDNDNAGQEGGQAGTMGKFVFCHCYSFYCPLFFFPCTTKTGRTGWDGVGRGSVGSNSNAGQDGGQAGRRRREEKVVGRRAGKEHRDS